MGEKNQLQCPSPPIPHSCGEIPMACTYIKGDVMLLSQLWPQKAARFRGRKETRGWHLCLAHRYFGKDGRVFKRVDWKHAAWAHIIRTGSSTAGLKFSRFKLIKKHAAFISGIRMSHRSRCRKRRLQSSLRRCRVMTCHHMHVGRFSYLLS